MANIILPTYRSIVENEIFGRKATPMQHPEDGKIAMTQILMLTRSRIPTKDEVINYIEKTANSDHSSYLLKFLPASEIQQIAKGDKERIEHLKNHYVHIDLQEGRSYLRLFNGIIPNKKLNSAKRSLKEKHDEYANAIVGGTEKNWILRIRLLDDGKLPDKLELEYLLARGVRDSDVLSAKGDFGCYQNIANQVMLLRDTFDSSEAVAQIKDISDILLNQQVTLALMETSKCLATRDVINGLDGLMKEISKELKEKKSEDRTKKPFDNCGFFLN